METALNAFFSLVFGVLLFAASLKAFVGAAQAVRQARVLRRHGLSTTATIVSLGEDDRERGIRKFLVRFDANPGTVEGTAYLSRKVSLEMVPGAEVQVRYDPTTPSIFALESGHRQGKAEIREAAVIFVLVLVFCLPTSIVMVGYAAGTALP